MSKNRTLQRRPGVAFRTWFGAVAVLTTAALGFSLLSHQGSDVPAAAAAGVAVDVGAGEQNFVPIVTDPDGTDAKVNSKNTAKAASKANPFTAAKVCAGYTEVKRLTLNGGTVHLTKSGNNYCVVTLKTTNVGTKTPVSAELGNSKDAGNFANYAGPIKASPSGCFLFGGSVGSEETDRRTDKYGTGCYPTKPAPAKGNPFTAVKVCAGYTEVKQLPVAGGTVHLTQRGNSFCVVTLKTTNVGTKSPVAAHISSKKDAGNFANYAGPVQYVPAAMECVTWGGSVGNSSTKGQFGDCGATPPPPPPAKANPYTAAKVCTGYTEVKRLTLNGGTVYLTKKGNDFCVVTVKTTNVGIKTPVSAQLVGSTDAGNFANYAGPLKASPSGCFLFGGSVGDDKRTDKYGTGCYPTKPAPAKANPFTATKVCAGYKEVKRLTVAGGTVYLTQRGNSYCVVTLKTTNVGTKSPVAAHISSKREAGTFANYAGPVRYTPAAQECVTWGGSVGYAMKVAQFGSCGETAPQPSAQPQPTAQPNPKPRP